MTKVYQVLNAKDFEKLFWIKKVKLELKKKNIVTSIQALQIHWHVKYSLNQLALGFMSAENIFRDTTESFESFSNINKQV